jgi:hypothetical protein
MKKDKQSRFKAKVMDSLSKQLDIRSIFQTHTSLKLLMKYTLTRKQRKLLAYQRRRLTTLDDDGSSESDHPELKDPWSKSKVKKFVAGLDSFETKTELDRSLLLGVLERIQPSTPPGARLEHHIEDDDVSLGSVQPDFRKHQRYAFEISGNGEERKYPPRRFKHQSRH